MFLAKFRLYNYKSFGDSGWLEFPQHQYFIATHSPMIIAAANPSTIVKLRYEDGESKAEVMNLDDIKEQRSTKAADNIFYIYDRLSL